MDSDFLEKRDELRNLWMYKHPSKVPEKSELQDFCDIYYGNANRFALYGLDIDQMYHYGIRVTCRTVVDCIIDSYAIDLVDQLALKLRSVFPKFCFSTIVDLFAGSGNWLYHLENKFKVKNSFGFEIDPIIFSLMQGNFSKINFPVELYLGDCDELIGKEHVVSDGFSLISLTPPWLDSFNHSLGLDFTNLYPRINGLIKKILTIKQNNRAVFVIQAHRKIANESFANTFGRNDEFESSIVLPKAESSNTSLIFMLNKQLINKVS